MNTINAPDFAAEFEQNGSVNTLFGNLDEGRVAWVNGGDPTRSTSFEPRDGVQEYLSDQLELKGASDILFDDLDIVDNENSQAVASDVESTDDLDLDGL